MDTLLASLVILVAQCTGPYCGPDVSFERPDDGVWGQASAPAVAMATEGTLYVAWESWADGERDVYFNRRAPGAGGEWGEPARLDDDEPGEARSLEVRLVAGPGRFVYAAWQDARHGADDPYFRRSTDGGLTWGESDARVGSSAPGAATSSMISLAADGTGRVYLAWEDLRDGERDIRFARSTDHGATWSPDVRLDGGVAGTAPSYHPQLAAWDDGSVVAVWWDERDGASDLRARRSTDGGATWPDPDFRLDEGEPGASLSRHACLSVAGDVLVVAWEEGRAEPNATILARTTPDRGATWEPVVTYGQGTGVAVLARPNELPCVGWVSRDPRVRVEKTSVGGKIVNIGPPVRLHASHGKRPGDELLQRSLSAMDGPASVWLGGTGDDVAYVARSGSSGGRGVVEVFESRPPWEGAAKSDWHRLKIVPFGSELLFTDREVSAHSLRGSVAADGTVHLVWVVDLAGSTSLGYAHVPPGAPPRPPDG